MTGGAGRSKIQGWLYLLFSCALAAEQHASLEGRHGPSDHAFRRDQRAIGGSGTNRSPSVNWLNARSRGVRLWPCTRAATSVSDRADDAKIAGASFVRMRWASRYSPARTDGSVSASARRTRSSYVGLA